MKPLTWTHEKLQQAIDGEISIFDRAGFQKPYKLNTQQHDRLDEAKQISYLTLSSREYSEALQNAWWTDCELSSQPYVRVVKRASRADVCIELTSSCFLLTRHGTKAVERMVEDMATSCRKRVHMISIGDDLIYVHNVPACKSDKIAAFMAKVASVHVRFHA